jgi:hypothetical protein
MILPLSLAGLLLVALAGCEQRPPAPAAPSGGSAAQQPAAELPRTLFAVEPIAGAQDVLALKKSAEAGKEVVLHGRIGGREDPFVPGRAIFMVADMSLPPCNARSSDMCATPWDYCCEPKDALTAATATVQVVGSDGKPLRIDLSKSPELKPRAEVTIRGTVSQKEGEQTLVIDAQSIYVKKS